MALETMKNTKRVALSMHLRFRVKNLNRENLHIYFPQLHSAA